ncbi:MAG: hypothetical protein EPN36_01050 [Rhodanobacteraceae bacterium]|nr:MAG: hypothetical protein EPN36_01050 [Rhodanobacteraceae bacterium]
MRSYRCVCVMAASLLASTAAFAGEPASGPFDISTPQSFELQAARVRAGLDPGGIYDFASARDRARVDQAIAVMDTLFRRYGSIRTMRGAQRVELFNAQESVNWILTRGRTGNIRCVWTRQTGSHIPRTLCWSIEA